MSNAPTKGKRPRDEESPAAAPSKLEADGVEAPPSPIAAPAPSVAEASPKVAAAEPADKPAPTPAAPPPAPAAPAEPATRRYKVWPHGTLQRDGVTFKPGDELTLPVDVGSQIPCLEPV